MLHPVDIGMVGVFLVWGFLNVQVIVRSVQVTRLAARQEPPIPGPTLREWTKQGAAPADTDPALQRAIRRMAQWRALARRFFLVTVAAVLALIALNRFG